ncbi:putative sulfate exporter family transporter [Aromatoleum toluclasticum]|uniref:YeiH family protein n=1 Tax=Aromatoleum toluclasticum TaxID=92003 RepID=UPI001D18E472|nr:putative sulfate exporter family transporter [Aromatoleum toluclasticum]MCC4118697.1 putative sulfate exporter family transporter [Aromatoleum toluclasticum]
MSVQMRAMTILNFPAWSQLWPGVLTAITIALAASFVSEHQGGPQLLYALFFGMAFNFAAEGEKIRRGIEFASRQVLRFGVALLGARITAEQLAGLGAQSIAMVAGGVLATILFGALIGRLLGRPGTEGVLTGGAVAICGASAALAISAVLPKNEANQRFTLFTVVGVTALSTVAMIVYPAVVKAFGLDANAAAVFLGGTIHDVAQVVAAGYILSPEVGDGAVFVKLFRVAMLLPVVAVVSVLFRDGTVTGKKPPVLPGFLVGFAVLVVVNSLGFIPKPVTDAASHLSRWCLVVAIAALGVKTSFQQLAALGWRPVVMLTANTVFLAALILGGLMLMR